MLPGFDNLRMESFMPIHEGFKSMQDDQESFTADEINKIHSEEDDFADIQTMKPTEANTMQKPGRNNSTAKNNTKATEPVIMSEEDDTKEFITKYIESEESESNEGRNNTKAINKAENNKMSNNKNNVEKTPTTTTTEAVVIETEETGAIEGFQGSIITQMGTNKLILVTLIITMISSVLNMLPTRKLLGKWMNQNIDIISYFIVPVIFALLVFIVLKIFC